MIKQKLHQPQQREHAGKVLGYSQNSLNSIIVGLMVCNYSNHSTNSKPTHSSQPPGNLICIWRPSNCQMPVKCQEEEGGTRVGLQLTGFITDFLSHMASSTSRQDESKSALWLATRAGKVELSFPLGTTPVLCKKHFPEIINHLLRVFGLDYVIRAMVASYADPPWDFHTIPLLLKMYVQREGSQCEWGAKSV